MSIEKKLAPAGTDTLRGTTIYCYDVGGEGFCPSCLESKHDWKVKDREALVALWATHEQVAGEFILPDLRDPFGTEKFPRPLLAEHLGGNFSCECCGDQIGAAQ